MKNLLILLLVVLVSGLLLGGVYLLGKGSQKQTPEYITDENTPTEKEFVSPTEEPAQTGPGIIEGSLSFPSEGIPEDMQVCAETLENTVVVCTGNQIDDEKYTYGVGYTLEVPAGRYFVYAQSQSFNEEYKAYFSDFVTCGLSAECTSHDPIVVEVSAGQTTEGVDPQDWYNQ